MNTRLWLGSLRDGFTLRVFFGVAAPLVLLAVLFNGIFAYQQRAVLTNLALQNGAAAARLLAHNARLPVFSNNRQRLQGLAETLLHDTVFRRVCVFDLERNVLVSAANDPDLGDCAVAGRSAAQWLSSQTSDQGQIVEQERYYVFWQPIVGQEVRSPVNDVYYGDDAPSDTLFGFIAVSADKQRIAGDVTAILWRNLLLMGIFLVLGGFTTFAVVNWALRPLRRLARTAEERNRELCRDDGGGGETSLTSRRDTYEELVYGLKRAFDTIREFNERLDAQVAERTAELQEANRELQQIREQLEDRVQRRTAALEDAHKQLLQAEKLSAIGQISASVAHEFNNPVCGIRTIIAELKQGNLDAEEIGLADLAIGECDRIARLIHDLQQFSRPSSAGRAEVDINRALETMLRLMAKEMSRVGVQSVLDLAPDLPPVMGTEDQLKQVFLNLLKNATDAMAERGGAVTVCSRRDNGHVEVRVEDTGPGIEPEHLPHIFEPFYTTKSAVKGTGLGLSVSHGIVRHHGGSILVHSEVGRGAKFSVLLPIQREVP